MRYLLVLTLLFGCLGIAFAAPVDPAVYSDLHWRLIGPFRGGRVLAVEGVPGQPDHFYFGSVGGGVWESRDAGRTWDPIMDEMPVASIGAIAVAPSNPDVLYVGAGEADMRSDIGYGNGVYKSTDAGKTWKHAGLTDTHQIGRVLVDPANADIAYVAALGHAYGPNPERGVFRTTDGGANWEKVLFKDDSTGAIDLAFGENPKTIYAALWNTRRPPWNVYPPSYGPGSGLYKSTDGGATWNEITGNGLPHASLGRIGIAVAPSRKSLVYAIVDADAGGLYRSEDSGASWKLTSNDARLWKRGWYFGAVTVDPANPDVVYICNVTVFRSTDGGRTFTPFRGNPGGDDYHQLWIDPGNPRRMIVGADQGAVVTVNGGETWSSWHNQATGQFYHAVTDNRFPFWVYGAQQDSGAAGVPSRTGEADGISIRHFREVTAGYENGYIAPDPLNPDLIYGGSVDRYDIRTGQTRKLDPTLAYPDVYRRVWTMPLVFSPKNPRVLYYSNQCLFRTSDGGEHWQKLTGDMTRETLTVPPNLDAASVNNSSILSDRRGVIYAIAPSPMDEQVIWIGTDDGYIWRSADGGANWQNITPAALTPWSKVGILEASHFDAQTAYAAIDRHRLDDYKPYIYRTTDAGKTWTAIASGIPDGHFVNVIREDPVSRGLLYAGTELGVFVSFDDGDHWQPLQLNLPASSVRDIEVHGTDLVAGTHGRAFWILDDITPLRQAAAAAAQASPYLFDPAPAVRFHPSGFTGTPLPLDEPKAANPPFGAMIDYYLKRDAGEVTIEVLDSANKRVALFSSKDKAAAPDPARIVVTMEWFASPGALRTGAGHHRFVWNLHYPFPEILTGYEMLSGVVPAGRWVLPGSYTVRLTVDGQAQARTLTVLKDPRVDISDAGLKRQFDLVQQVEASRIRLATAMAEATGLLQQTESLKGSHPELRQQLSSFQQKITALTEMTPKPILWGAPGGTPLRISGFLYLEQALGDLQEAAENADAAPSPDLVQGFETRSAVLNDTLLKWESLKEKDLGGINTLLKRKKLPALKP